MRKKWNFAVNQDLKTTSYVCELHFNPEDVIKSNQEILADGSIYVYEYEKVHLRKKTVPKCNRANNDKENNESLLSDDVSLNTSDIIIEDVVSDCSLHAIETSIVNEPLNEVIGPETTNEPETINEPEKFSFHFIKKTLEAQPLRKNWSWTIIKNANISLSYINSKLELVCHAKIDINLKVTVRS